MHKEQFSKLSSKKILITGGAGFIGSQVVRRFVNKYPEYEIFNLDVLTYAGNLENLAYIHKFIGKDEIDAATEKYGKSKYGEYLSTLV